MLETLLAKLGLPLLMNVIGGALGQIDNPIAQKAAGALKEAQDALATGAISPEAQVEANRHLEAMTQLAQKERSDAIAQVNESLRAEVASSDPYVRRMRPTFGYLMAVTWAAQMLALAYVIIFDTVHAAGVLNAIESLSTIWGVALSVLGIYVYKRSDEKKGASPIIHVQESAADAASAPPVPARKPFNG
jgi:hypothetical protein